MPYCPRCGVEVDASVRWCPLCRTPVPVFDDLAPGEPAWPSAADRARDGDPSRTYATPGQRRGRTFLALAAVAVTAALTVALVDLLRSGSLTWSLYPLVALGAAVLYLGTGLAWHRRTGALSAAWLGVTAVLLFGLDAADGAWQWSPSLGMPLLAVTFGLAATGSWLLRHSRRRGYNAIALFLALAASELLAIDALVTAWATGSPAWGWSLVTTLALGPLTFLFLVLHWAIRRTPDLRRTFHF